jgi:hypothetical protein
MEGKRMNTNPREILNNPYYEVLRTHFNRPAKDALEAVRWFEAFRQQIIEERKAREKEDDKQD